MKTTIPGPYGKVTVEPLPDFAVQLTVDQGMDYATVELTRDQVAALIFGLEKAAEAAGVAQELRDYIESRKAKNKTAAA